MSGGWIKKEILHLWKFMGILVLMEFVRLDSNGFARLKTEIKSDNFDSKHENLP